MPKIPDAPFRICYVCGDKLTKRNAAGFYDGRLTPYCRTCHAEVSYCKQWRKKPIKNIKSHILDLKRRIYVLSKIIQRRETGIPKVGRWRAKMK